MKTVKLLNSLLLLTILFVYSCASTKKATPVEPNVIEVVEEVVNVQEVTYMTKSDTDANGYKYEYVSNDPSKTRIYTLDNGLKVYLSVYQDEPRIQTLIPVKAGGKFDPANSTGLAHYLEHMMFKGNHNFGTKDWEKEKVELDKIEQMFEEYRTITDTTARKAHYAKIDSISNEASKYAIANEYDKLVQFVGATGTNAYTTEDRTVYVNNIPANQLENWIQIESKRFEKIVNRLFHTELEAVYEEKNRSLDNDRWKVYENMYKLIFDDHTYGKQTVIGTIEHLKNPSITDIVAYFNKYYVPNNMAVCLAGDLDPEKTIQLVDQYFGKFETKPINKYIPAVEKPITTPRELTIYGPDAENVSIGFRVSGTASEDAAKTKMVDMMLNNSMAGLIDLNLVQKQKVLGAGCYPDLMNDYGVHTFYGNPREGQSLEEVKDLILGEIDKIKRGEFEDWLMPAIINDFKKTQMQGLQNSYSRANNMVMAFTNNMKWSDFIDEIETMSKITKEELIAYANKHYGNNYGVIYKKTGEDPNKLKVDKPSITKVDLDRKSRSPFFESIIANDIPKLKPMFIDYEKDFSKFTMKSDVPVLYKQNEENDLFTMYYLIESGTNENPKLKMALDYLQYLGTGDKTSEDVKKEFYKLGCDFSVFSGEERVYVYLSGIQDNMSDALELFEELLENPRVDNQDILSNLKSDAHKKRADSKKDKNTILWSGLASYAKYGKDSPFTNVLSNEDLNTLRSEELEDVIKNIQQSEHMVMYYGPMSEQDLKMTLNKQHRVPETLKPLPEKKIFKELSSADPTVVWSDYDMVQAEILFQHKGQAYDKDLSPEVKLFNEYFGGMSGIAFQEIREAQGLAYSVFTGYSQGNKEGKDDVLRAYVGTQADKQDEAMNAMVNLLNVMPESEQTFQNAKKAILENIESERITKTRVFFNYLDAQRKGLDYDIRKDIYTKMQNMTFSDLKAFHSKYISGKKFNIAVVGDKDKLNFTALDKFGKVKELSLDEIFGYEEYEVKKVERP